MAIKYKRDPNAFTVEEFGNRYEIRYKKHKLAITIRDNKVYGAKGYLFGVMPVKLDKYDGTSVDNIEELFQNFINDQRHIIEID